MNADGTGAIAIADGDDPTWAPDGSRVAFQRHDGNDYEIYSVAPYRPTVMQLTSNDTTDWESAWSPDGKKIAFAGEQNAAQGDSDICVMDANGANIRNLTKSGVRDRCPAWCPAPSVVRSLIGASGSDGGDDPPFGAERPLAIVAVTDDGLVSAVTVGLPETTWSSIRAAKLSGLGSRLAGIKITATRISNVQEDRGRGLPPRLWDLRATPGTGAALIFFSAETGRITSVIGSGDTSLGGGAAEQPAQVAAGRIVLRGSFVAAYNADCPDRNLLPNAVRSLVLDARGGKVIVPG